MEFKFMLRLGVFYISNICVFGVLRLVSLFCDKFFVSIECWVRDLDVCEVMFLVRFIII